MTFCDWMGAALYDEYEGYYRRNDIQRWGREGDYRTSPERSGLFAATFARYFAELYERNGRPSEWAIVEVGAGDGSFAFGVLATLQRDFPEVFSATNYLVDEIGESSKVVARQRLAPLAGRIAFTTLNEVRSAQGIVFSNELLDAFPVHRVTMRAGKLREFFVDVNPQGEFVWTPGTPSSEKLNGYLDRFEIELVENQIIEINLAVEDWVRSAAAAIDRGYLITVDYGDEAGELYAESLRPEGTLRGFRKHQLVDDLLADPGEQDLTSSVNWTAVKKVSEGLGFKTIDFQRGDKFLLAAGLLTQLQLESQSAADEVERIKLTTATREMILPDGMAASFQVLVQQK
jgi:SAM-dependent MidA family methyltransferase